MSHAVRIVLVEDDINQSRLLAEKILEICDANKIDARITRYFSEHSFMRFVRADDFQPPEFAIIDLMLHYYSPNDLESIPLANEEIERAEVKRAGMRCYDELKKKSPATKILLITVLRGEEISEIPESYAVANKGTQHDELLLTEFLLSGSE